MTDRQPALPERAADARRASAAAAAFSGGVVAAGLGLGALAVVVITLWITSPFPDNGLDGALCLAADLWLLAHGAALVRTDTLSGVPAPIGLTPLLLTLLPAWLLYRAAGDAVAPAEGEGDGEDAPAVAPRDAAVAVGWLVTGYLVIGVGVVLYTSYGQVRSDPVSALLHLPVVAVLAAGAGAWSGCGRPAAVLPRIPRLPWAVRRRLDAFALPRRLSLPDGGPLVALRAAAASTAVLVGGGAVLGGASLVWHERLVGHSFAQLSASVSGQCAVLLVALALVPNMAVWGASYALGPGFAVGAGSVAPVGLGTYGPFRPPGPSPDVLPNFPLLAALPAPGGAPLQWAVLLLPVLAGACAAVLVGRGAAAGSWRPARTARVAALAAVGCGAATGLLAAWSAGPMGSGALADFGPAWWAAGAAALGWTALVGVAGAVGVRWWHVRIPAEPVSWRERWEKVRRVFRWRWGRPRWRWPWRWFRSKPEAAPVPVVPPSVD
ncbi:cell division protein PerM [Streptomyces sp. H39-S7]|uniref:cell division protein PerM n=1 Tax=Streptomyces sp. H39-S7 TaxID=3004357 RepID=UPI0022AE8807|nr:DUF6350 family protein [Streptomyces sp. H39-S7]MCZ4120670.1 DUF6350 family protein [Streptomyces sp. H39-S7]